MTFVVASPARMQTGVPARDSNAASRPPTPPGPSTATLIGSFATVAPIIERDGANASHEWLLPFGA